MTMKMMSIFIAVLIGYKELLPTSTQLNCQSPYLI